MTDALQLYADGRPLTRVDPDEWAIIVEMARDGMDGNEADRHTARDLLTKEIEQLGYSRGMARMLIVVARREASAAPPNLHAKKED